MSNIAPNWTSVRAIRCAFGQKVAEDKGKFRLQAFEGLVLARKHALKPEPLSPFRKVIDASVSSVFFRSIRHDRRGGDGPPFQGPPSQSSILSAVKLPKRSGTRCAAS